MNIAVVGTGYVGLVTGACLAETGNNVICVDNNISKVKSLLDGQVPIYEPQLDLLVAKNTKAGRLHFTTDLATAVNSSTVVFLALPTPPGEDGSADLSYILGVAKQLGPLINEYKVVVNKSTVPVGTAELVRAEIQKNCGQSFDVVSNPEFLREGFAVEDFMKPERVVIGSSSDKASVIMKELYAPYVRQGNPIYLKDERSAELTKYAANAFLATKISFMNEVANLCERTGANVDAVRIGIGSDSRIGKRFLFAGIGYGGSCFPKDVQALAKTASDHDYNFRILDSVMEVNDHQKMIIVDKIKSHFKSLKGLKIAIWGLAFKPDTDDMREAPSLTIIKELLANGASISAYDPQAMSKAALEFGDQVHMGDGPYDVLENADALIIATEWTEFRAPDFIRMTQLLKNKLIFDGRNLFENEHMNRIGYTYYSMGRPPVVNVNSPLDTIS